MNSADTDYFLQRAQTECGLAREAVHERAVHAHSALAKLYLEQACRRGGSAFQPRETVDAEHA